MRYYLSVDGSRRQAIPTHAALVGEVTTVLVGYYEHSLDAKGRVKVPQALREIGGGEGLWTQFYLAPGPEGCVFVYPPDRWKEITNTLFRSKVLPTARIRSFQRLFSSRASLCKCDGVGRLVVPERLIKHAALEPAGKVAWIGADDRLELWDKERWQRFEDETHTTFDDVFEQMAELHGGTPPTQDEQNPTRGGGEWVPDNNKT